MKKLLLVIPPFTQTNCPYPSTAYLKGYLSRKGYDVAQYDLSIELINSIFSKDFLIKVFGNYKNSKDDNLERIYALKDNYLDTIECVMSFLRGEDNSFSNLICSADFLPQAGRFESATDLEYFFGNLGSIDCAKYLSTLYLQDLSDLIRYVITPHFEIVRYGEQISLSVDSFSKLESELSKPNNLIESEMLNLFKQKIDIEQPTHIGFSVPFPGNMLSALRCAQFIKHEYPEITTLMGGGYPNTELRQMSDKGIFSYINYLILDDGELAIERILSDGELLNTYTIDSYNEGNGIVLSHKDRGCPDFDGLPHSKYISLTEVTNPMHRLWSDGRWNKMMIAHGCYWAKCAFCDTKLDYICRYDAVPASTFVDWMENVITQTGSRGFHFVDEAAPPKILKEISLEILRRKLKVSWWANIRFENSFTTDLASLMASAGCIAVSGGLEVASDRLLSLMNKGVTIEQATLAMRSFYYAGIMVHSYLMYGFPSQTLGETVDSLEVVRQLFRAQLISSAFWHRYAMTTHSPSGQEPEKYGISNRQTKVNAFANNELTFVESRQYNLNMVGDALNEALVNYLYTNDIEKPVHKWFSGKVPITTVENSLITDHLIKPDLSKIYDDSARVIWIGANPTTNTANDTSITFRSNTGFKTVKFDLAHISFIMEVIELCKDLTQNITYLQIKEIYAKYSPEPFVILYHSKKWDIVRSYGLLQI